MKRLKVITCDECGKKFVPGNTLNGLPNGVTFVLKDGSTYTACCECICKRGMAAELRGKPKN